MPVKFQNRPAQFLMGGWFNLPARCGNNPELDLHPPVVVLDAWREGEEHDPQRALF
jgi:hypothetical protein